MRDLGTWLVMAVGVLVGILLIALVVVFTARAMGLFIPKSRLHDDAYVNKASRRYWRFILFFRWAGGVLAVLTAAFFALHLAGFNVLSPPLGWWVLGIFCATCVLLMFGFGTQRHNTPHKTDVWQAVQQSRSARFADENAPPARRWIGRVVWVLVVLAGLGFFIWLMLDVAKDIFATVG